MYERMYDLYFMFPQYLHLVTIKTTKNVSNDKLINVVC